ncbi:hypothetical protein M413DRAFT_26124 [Hebeloma cylindrosporum]|uniref:F-box domain-containing protein n=1 Tax=Hebeloma cylindrosporum TaxID=76867 RepID=A0A0C3CJB5_HEBCY|nr:hypothetical protein M413DRAFT_26124 [Hebeloma cylindrosporum h7]
MSTLRWASPIRRDGLRELSSIPNEIYLEIMSYLKPSNSPSADPGSSTQDLRNMARVCRYFCSIALPWIFESFSLVIGGTEAGSGPESRTKFCRRLLNGEEAAQTVARFVKKCTISLASQCTEVGWALREVLSMYSKAIAHMPNIEEIVLSEVFIDNDTLKSLGGLKRLKTLRLLGCELVRDAKEKHLAKLSTLRLSFFELRLFPHHLDESNESLIPFLKQINWSCITKFMATEVAPIIESAWLSSKSLPLVELDLFFMEMGPLFHVLTQTPSLRILRIRSAPDPHQTPPDSSTVPMLEELKAPSSVCRMLVPGRPITNLSLIDMNKPMTLGLAEANIFQATSRPISQLRVPVEFYLSVPFWRHFPSLRTLRLDLVDYHGTMGHTIRFPIQQTISNFTEAWPRHPPLHTLVFESGTFWRTKELLDLEQQHSWIKSSLMPKFPALRICSFSKHIEWHYEHCDEANALWKPSIPDSHVHEVRKLLQRVGGGHFIDFDNCFEKILFPPSPS